MASRHLTLRLPPETFARLDSESRGSGRSRSELARTLLEEGLRMQAHPGVVFRSGPAGRRPGLAGGPDVWEVACVLREMRGTPDDVVKQAADLSGQPVEQLRRALRYYAEYREEIDEWIRANEDEAQHAEAAWRREQALLRR